MVGCLPGIRHIGSASEQTSSLNTGCERSPATLIHAQVLPECSPNGAPPPWACHSAGPREQSLGVLIDVQGNKQPERRSTAIAKQHRAGLPWLDNKAKAIIVIGALLVSISLAAVMVGLGYSSTNIGVDRTVSAGGLVAAASPQND